MTTDLRTEKEKERARMHKAIGDEYNRLCALQPDTSANRKFSTIANNHGMTLMGVRNIIIRLGLYTPGGC